MPGQSYNIGVLPKSMQEHVRENLRDTNSWSPELKALLDPNVEARRTNLPTVSQFHIINREYVYYLARRTKTASDGNNYLKLRYAGFVNATCDPKCQDDSGNCGCDVHPLMMDISSDGTEITMGPDLVLVKARPDVYYGRIKTYIQRSIDMTDPRKREGIDMLTSRMNPEERNALSQTRTYAPSEGEINGIAAHANATNSVRRGTPQWDKIAKKGKEE